MGGAVCREVWLRWRVETHRAFPLAARLTSFSQADHEITRQIAALGFSGWSISRVHSTIGNHEKQSGNEKK
jgi:hypothetical protein